MTWTSWSDWKSTWIRKVNQNDNLAGSILTMTYDRCTDILTMTSTDVQIYNWVVIHRAVAEKLILLRNNPGWSNIWYIFLFLHHMWFLNNRSLPDVLHLHMVYSTFLINGGLLREEEKNIRHEHLNEKYLSLSHNAM